jgi:WD40 repeat protein
MNGTFNDNIICFDVFQNDEKFLVFFGKDDGFVDVFTVNKKDFMQNLEMRDSNITPNFKKDLSIVASEILLNNISINRNDEDNADLFINYVKYFSQNKLITTSNDSHFKIIDLEKNVTEQKYKNDFPINHCDLNDNKNVLLCIGDSKIINLVDLKSNKIINTLNEHFDYGIVIKFNPYNNTYFASGNQDFGCKIWDTRMLDKGSVSTSWGLCDNIGDLDWIDSDSLCYMENSFFSHIFNFKTNKIQDLSFFKIGNGIVHDKINNDIYLNTYKVNEDNPCGILCYETLKNKIYNSFNNINL